MQKPRIISTITERLPYRREQNVPLLETDDESVQLHEELEAYNYNQPYYMVAESIGRGERAAKLLGRVQPEIQDMIIINAHDLAARILPPHISGTLNIAAKHPENIGLEYIEGQAPSLRALHLLLHAYDSTKDTGLRHAVTYIIQTCPPALSEFHREAYEYGTETDTAVISSLQELAAYADDKLDEETR